MAKITQPKEEVVEVTETTDQNAETAAPKVLDATILETVIERLNDILKQAEDTAAQLQAQLTQVNNQRIAFQGQRQLAQDLLKQAK